jgi:hypothetical protein
MTEHDHLRDDEIVSAYLDGEATPAEVARVEAEPALQARLEQFRAGAALVADTPRADPSARDAHLARARDAFPTATNDAVPDDAGPTDATVHDLDAARQRRTRTFIFSAAAVVVALVLGASLLPRLLDDDPEQFTAVGSAIDDGADIEASDRAAPDGEAPAAAAPEADSSPPSTAPGLAEGGAIEPLPDLGSFAERAELDLALDAAIGGDDTDDLSSVPPDGVLVAASSCAADLLGADPELQDLLYGATAVLAGVDIEVLVFATDPTTSVNGPRRLYLVDRATCAPVAGGVETLTP